MGRLAESSFPWIIALCAAGISAYLGFSIADTKFDGMLTAAINVSAILMGFLGTAKAMLLTFRSKKFDWMKSRREVWSSMLDYFKVALLSNFLLCIVSFVLLAVPSKDIASWLQYLVPVWVGCATFAIAAFYRVLNLFFILLASE